jgi:hypothetical protein
LLVPVESNLHEAFVRQFASLLRHDQ